MAINDVTTMPVEAAKTYAMTPNPMERGNFERAITNQFKELSYNRPDRKVNIFVGDINFTSDTVILPLNQDLLRELEMQPISDIVVQFNPETTTQEFARVRGEIIKQLQDYNLFPEYNTGRYDEDPVIDIN